MALKYEINIVSISLVLLYFNFLLPSVDAEFGILYAKNNSSSTERFCMLYNPKFSSIPEDFEHAVFFPLKNLIPDDGCNFTSPIPSLADKIIMVNKGGCSLARKGYNVQDVGGKAVIVGYPHIGTPVANDSDYNNINITIAIVEDTDASKIMKMGPYVEVAFSSEPHSTFHIDYSVIGIWLMAMFVVTVGGLWSGVFKHQLYVAKSKSTTDQASDSVNTVQQDTSESTSLDIGPKFIVIFVLMMCAMLLLLYFFFDYLVYLIIALFCVSASFSLFYCISALFHLLPCNLMCKFSINWPRNVTVDIMSLLIFAASVSLGVCWGIYRNASFSWILQDILGVAFCIHALKMIRLPNLKVCVVLLSLLLIYDIFFVFITPLFTKSGESVMVEVATGSNSHSTEQLPVVLKVPHLSFGDNSLCNFAYSLLGFGDLLIPGLLISYCHSFDLKVNSNRIYFISTVMAYGFGLLITFIALAVMQEGQPALLYLVPCTLLTVICIGWKKGDLKHLWKGELIYVEEVNVNPRPVLTKMSEDRIVSETIQSQDKEQLID